MIAEPPVKRTLAYIDGQNLFHGAKESFGHSYPNYDIKALADEVRTIAKEHGRWVKIASAFPFSPTTHNKRGVNSTDWIRIDRATYDACLDPHDYRPRKLSD